MASNSFAVSGLVFLFDFLIGSTQYAIALFISYEATKKKSPAF